MGGLSKLRALLRERWPAAFVAGVPDLRPGAVFISDDLTRAHRFRGKTSAFMTGSEFMARWLEGVMHELRSGVVKTYIAVYDNPALVPQEKAQEQKRRREGKKPYPEHSTIADAGIRVAPSGPFAPFDVNRLLMSTHMRKELFRYILHKLRNTLLPPGTALIFDYSTKGPVVFAHNRCAQWTDVPRLFGEADLQCVWWLTQIPEGRDVLVSSIDSDLMVILAWFRHATRRERVFWVYERGLFMDVTVFEEGARSAAGSFAHFVRACCCCGNDFVEKGVLFPFFSEADILRPLATTDTARALVECAYSAKLDGPRAPHQPLERLRRLCAERGTRFGPPPPDDAPVWGAIEWNVGYWTVDWNAHVPLARTKEFPW